MDPIVSAPLVVLLTTLLDGMSLYGVCCVSLGAVSYTHLTLPTKLEV